MSETFSGLDLRYARVIKSLYVNMPSHKRSQAVSSFVEYTHDTAMEQGRAYAWLYKHHLVVCHEREIIYAPLLDALAADAVVLIGTYDASVHASDILQDVLYVIDELFPTCNVRW